MGSLELRRAVMMAMAEANSGLVEKMASGELTIDTNAFEIIIEHGLGKIPDMIALWGDYDYDEQIPYGCCVRCTFLRSPFAVLDYWLSKNSFTYEYMYRNASGKMLGGCATSPARNFTNTTAKVARGICDWASVDANGNKVKYKWFAVRFKDSEK